MWWGVEEDNKNRRRMVDEYNKSNETELAASVALSESDLEIPFGFEGKEVAEISSG